MAGAGHLGLCGGPLLAQLDCHSKPFLRPLRVLCLPCWAVWGAAGAPCPSAGLLPALQMAAEACWAVLDLRTYTFAVDFAAAIATKHPAYPAQALPHSNARLLCICKSATA